MSIFFLNSANRIYNDKELNKLPQILFSSGIFNTQQSTQALWRAQGDLFVEADETTMNISAKAGSATMRVTSGGKSQQVVIEQDIPLVASISANTSLAFRNDAVVLRVNQSIITNDQLNSQGSNAVSLTVIAGNSATRLSDAEITVALSGDPFLRLADILVPQNATAITQSMITDVRTIVRMTRATKLASDSLRLYGIAEDPTNLEQGDIWYNTMDGILKMFDGTNTIALQNQSFDFGYYPPNGIDDNNIFFDTIDSNDDAGSPTLVYQHKDVFNEDSTRMVGQRFKMPNIDIPFLRLKLGNPLGLGTLQAKIYAYSAGPILGSLVETFDAIAPSDIPRNDYLDILPSVALTPGNEYVLVIQSKTLSTGGENPPGDRYIEVMESSSATSEFLLNSYFGLLDNDVTNPASLTWYLSSGKNLVFEIIGLESLPISQTDISGNINKITQPFIAKSKDIQTFFMMKGVNSGTPTGDIDINLYEADIDNSPKGDVLATGTITSSEWNAFDLGEYAEISIAYDDLVIGTRYVIQIMADNPNDTNYYSVLASNSLNNLVSTFNTAQGWSTLNKTILFKTRTSPIRKIVVTDNQGLIPKNIIPTLAPKVREIVSSATPIYDVDIHDAISITALAENITNMSTNMSGTPMNFQKLKFRIKAIGASRNITWGDNFEAKGVALPTSVGENLIATIDFEYDSVTTKFGCILSVVTS